MAPTIRETDWEQFDGFTPTFEHPNLSTDDLRFLLGSAYTRFYIRPSFLANYLRITTPGLRTLVNSLDARVERRHTRHEAAAMERTLSC
jgi:hypothetical protein